MKARPIAERLSDKTDTQSSLSEWNGSRCHEWTGHITPNGYGQVHHSGETRYAHRVTWEVKCGPVPDDLYVLHRCDNRRCVNPDHLFLGTFDDNMNDMVAKRRQAHGDRGHHAKLSREDARAIRCSPEKQADLAKRYGITQSTVSAIQSGHTWRYV